MNALSLHKFHETLKARFAAVNGQEMAADYGDVEAEFAALRDMAGVMDLSFRSRLCLTGSDRVAFLHGQVTNDVKRLQTGQGCYAALANAKGRMESDLFIYALADELLLDFEPGLTDTVVNRLNRFIIADDVEVVEVAPHYGLLTVQGPGSDLVVRTLELGVEPPSAPLEVAHVSHNALGDLYLINQPRLRSAGFDLFVPTVSLGALADKLVAAAKQHNGRAVGWEAFEMARVVAGVPRFGADMNESNLAPEVIPNAINYSKGCYIGQEVISRIRTYGQVARALRRLKFDDSLPDLPVTGDKLFHSGKEVGHVTSAVKEPASRKAIGLGIVRRERNAPGTQLALNPNAEPGTVLVMEL